MRQIRISRAGCSLANLVLGVAAVPQPDALHPPHRTAPVQPSDVAMPPTQAAAAAPVHAASAPVHTATAPLHGATASMHAASSPSLHLPDYLPIGSGGSTALDTQALLLMGGKFVIVLV